MGGKESQGTSRVEQTVLAMLMESQIWHSSALWSLSSMLGGLSKETMTFSCLSVWEKVVPAPILMPDTYMPLMPDTYMPLMPFKLLPWCWSSDGSESE